MVVFGDKMAENSPKGSTNANEVAQKAPSSDPKIAQRDNNPQTNDVETEQKGNERKTKELTETLQRLQAEFENYQKRTQKQNAEFQEFATASLMEQLLAVLDSLEQGIVHNKEFVHIHEQLYSMLKKNGLMKMEIIEGDPFNHDRMECLISEPNPKLKEDSVAKVLLTGYLLNGKVLRHAKVSVVKNLAKCV